MNSKVVLLAVSIIAVGLFAMPSTLSLLVGQHTFLGGDDYTAPNRVDCATCHNNVKTEITANQGPHQALTACNGCHTGGSVYVSANKGGPGAKVGGKTMTTHAAKLNACTACHTQVPGQITNAGEPHKAMYDKASASGNALVGLIGADAACTACHTAAGAIAGGSLAMVNKDLYVSATLLPNGNYNVTYLIK